MIFGRSEGYRRFFMFRKFESTTQQGMLFENLFTAPALRDGVTLSYVRSAKSEFCHVSLVIALWAVIVTVALLRLSKAAIQPSQALLALVAATARREIQTGKPLTAATSRILYIGSEVGKSSS
jgi:hypothetical protein